MTSSTDRRGVRGSAFKFQKRSPRNSLCSARSDEGTPACLEPRSRSARRTMRAPPRGRHPGRQRPSDDDARADGEGPPWKRSLPVVGAMTLALLLSASILALGSRSQTSSSGTRKPHSPSHPGIGSAETDATPIPAVALGRDMSAGQAEEKETVVMRQWDGPPPQVLTLVASRNIKAVEAFYNSMSDVVLLDYSHDASTNCSFCVYVQHMPGVKWEILVRLLPFPTPMLLQAARLLNCLDERNICLFTGGFP